MPLESIVARGRATHLQQLFWLRNAALAIQGAAVIVAIHGANIDLPVVPVVAILAAMAAANVVTGLQLARGEPASERQVFVQILIDVAALTGLLFLTGGSTNPFTIFYLLPLTLAATMLSRRQTWIVLALAASCYTTLLFHYVPLTSVADDHELTMRMHTFGMWLTYLLSSGLIAYFVSRGRDRERLLAEAREAMLRDERVLAIGTMAAGAAHELGTPLTTIGVLAKELQDQYSDHATLVEDLTVLRRQVDACKTSVTHLLAAARKSQFEGATSLPVTEFVANVIAKWQLMRPVVHFENRVAGNPPVPAVVTDVTLGQAMMNLLNNAADASADNVEIRTGWNGEHITIEILDRGPGFPEAAMQSGGKAFFSTKEPDSGRGLGLFLARAAVERMGGSLQLTHREGGGAIARLELPTAGDKT